jgi:gluconolactonase
LDVQVEEFDSAIRQIVPEKATLEQIGAGFGFTEGPLWRGGHLLFSDIPRSRIVKLGTLGEGPEVTTFRSPSGNSNGLTLDMSGRLIACEHGTRRVTRTEVDGSVAALAERYQGHRLNSPNDVVVRSDGSVYFTDPSFGLGTPPKWKELPFNGVFRVAPDGELVLLVDDFDLPNGLAFSPDETVLYINDTAKGHIRAFDVSEDGSISNGRVLVELKGTEGGRPDGMKVDVEGNVYCTGPGGFWITQPDGKSLGRVMMQELPANLAWGDPDRQTLYFTARTGIYRMRLSIPGIVVP